MVYIFLLNGNKKMEEKLAHESKLIQIPIDKYEKDMDTELGREKKEEILNIFTNSNNLRSKEEFFNDIKPKLHILCSKGEVEHIRILFNETIQDSSQKLKFKIDKTNRTASLFKVSDDVEELIIPRTVEHESIDYIITSICIFRNKNIKKLKFSEDSEVETIYEYVFSSKIEKICFPASLKELKDGWCICTNYLTKITISPSNSHFKLIENKYLIGKSDENNNEFDTLLFACRDIEKISIPSNIKFISSYAFSNCTKLHTIEIPTNSNLQIIGLNAFERTQIEEIYIPPSITKICKYTFDHCQKLSKIIIPTNSNLQIIEMKAFTYSKITEIYFPESLKILEEWWCYGTFILTKIIVSPSNNRFKFNENKYLVGKSDENKDEFDTLLFADRKIREISIPSNIKIIATCAFYDCFYLQKVEIQPNSNLQTIKRAAFALSNIKELYFPASLKELKDGWCGCTNNLTKITISPSNNHFKFIKNKYLVGKSDENNDEFDTLLFASRDIEEISIPSNIKFISSYAFSDCTKLHRIYIPPSVSRILPYAFLSCYNLQIIEFHEESKLQSLAKSAFSGNKNLIIMIPSSLRNLIQ